MSSRKLLFLLCVFVGLTALAPVLADNLVANGGFEDPVVNPYAGLGVGSNIGAWLVSYGTVYLMNNAYMGEATAYEGQQYLQLNVAADWVQQTLATVPGQTYQVSFQMSGNATPGYGQNADNSLIVIWYDPQSATNIYQQTYTFHQNNTFENPMWQSHSFMITARTDHDLLAFGSATVQYPWLDAVSVTPYDVKGTITGRVYDAATNAGVPHAEVTSNSGVTTETDSNGDYTLELPGDATVDITSTQDDYYDGKVTGVTAVAETTTTADIPATHLPIPTASDVVTDSFDRASGYDLGSTDGLWPKPWIRSGSEALASISGNSLVLDAAQPSQPGFGVSLGGGFIPADLDMSVDLKIDPGSWASIGYRQQAPGVFDNFGGTDPGFMIMCPADGLHIYVWLMGGIGGATFDTPIDWSQWHRVRVRAIGTHHQVFLDGVRIVNATLITKTAGGYVSLMRDTSRAQFDNLVVTRFTNNHGQISGIVTDINNPTTRISNARLFLNSGEITKSDGFGSYVLDELAAGSYSLTVTADGYYPRTYSVVVADANTSVAQDIQLLPLPAPSNLVTDDFNREDNYDSLGTTNAPQFLPWITQPNTFQLAGGQLGLWYNDPVSAASIGGDFSPADLDVSASLSTGGSGGWAGIGYRQQMPDTYDGLNGQDPAQAGYVAYFTDAGTQVVLWRNGIIATANVDPALASMQMHVLRVRAVGSHHEVWVDGQKMIDACDSGKVAGGYVSLIANQEWVTGDDLSVGTYVDTAYQPTINDAKAAGVGSVVSLTGKVITAQWSGTTMYVEEPDGSAGIRVDVPQADSLLYTKVGETASVRGTLKVDAQTGELYIDSTIVEALPTRVALDPAVMDNQTANNKSGVPDVTGLYAKVAGTITAVNGTSDFTIDDGTGQLKIVVDPSLSMGKWSSVGAQVEIEGIVSLVGSSPASAIRCVKPWNTNANLFEQQGRNPGFEASNPMTNWGFLGSGGVAAAQTFGHAEAHGGSTYAQISNASGLAGNVYAMLYQIYTPNMVYGTAYKLSCWVRGNNLAPASEGNPLSNNWLGFWDYTRPGGGAYANVPAFPAVSDITTVPWQKMGTEFTWTNTCDGMPTGMWRFELLTQDIMTELDVDDFFLGHAKGTITETAPAPYTTVSGIADAKDQPDDTNVELDAKVVTASSAALGGKFYIEEQDRLGAIRCVLPAGATNFVAGGSTVNVQGTMSTTATGERQIVDALVTVSDPLPPVMPLFMTNKTIAALAASSMGLLVKTTGKVSQSETPVPGEFYLDDGSGVNLKVIGSVPSTGAYVTVVGIRSCEMDGGTVKPVLLATGVDVNKTVVAVTHFGGADQIWLRAADCVARSVDGGTPNFVADPVAAPTTLSGSALYFPCAPDSGYSNTDPAQQLPWWVEYQIDAADLGTLTLGGSWGIWCRTTQPAVSTVESDWIVVNGDPAFLNMSNPTNADWMATLSMPNFAATPGHVIVNNTSQSGSGGTLSGYVWGWWSRASATEIQHQPLNLVDGKLTFRIYEREAGLTNARLDLICWSSSDSYIPTDADAALVAGF